MLRDFRYMRLSMDIFQHRTVSIRIDGSMEYVVHYRTLQSVDEFRI
jgi:hypothetical protein